MVQAGDLSVGIATGLSFQHFPLNSGEFKLCCKILHFGKGKALVNTLATMPLVR